MAKEQPLKAATMSGRVLERLGQIEEWFRAGLKTKEVHARLTNEGIKIHYVNLINLLRRYGKSETQVRRAMAVEGGENPQVPSVAPLMTIPKTRENGSNKPPVPAGKKGVPTKATEALKRREQGRVEFKHDPNPPDKDSLI